MLRHCGSRDVSVDARGLAAQCVRRLAAVGADGHRPWRLHPICAIVTDARAGQSDGSLATYQLTMRDALSVQEGRTNTRIFRTLSVPDVIEKLLGEWQKRVLRSRARSISISTCRRWIARSIRCARRCCSFTSRTRISSGGCAVAWGCVVHGGGQAGSGPIGRRRR